MTPTVEHATELFHEVAEQNNIDITTIDKKYIDLIISGSQICNFKTVDLFFTYIETAVLQMPEKAIIK